MSPHRLFVTGATGFVGSMVVRQLVQAGRQVAILARASSDTWRIADLLDRLTIIHGDLEDVEALRPRLAAFAPEAVAHLAWRGVKGADRNHPMQVQNVAEALELYQLSKQAGSRRFVGLGSQAEYGPYSAKINESFATRPTTLYGAAKLSAALMLDRLSAAEGQSFAWLRLFSSYGPQDDPSWLLPYITLELLAGNRPALTLGEQLWDYIHVADVAAAVVATIDSEAHGIFNLGSGQARPLRDIITAIRDMIDPTLPLGFGEVPYRPDQVMHLEADISALTQATGWTPQVTLQDGLAQTVAWYRQLSTRAKII